MSSLKLAPLPPAEEEAVVKARFLYHVSVPRGEPPFKRVAKKLQSLLEEAEKPLGPGLDKAHEALVKEVSQLKLLADKYNANLTYNQIEQQNYQRKQEELAQQIEQAKRDIEARKLELEQAKVIRQQNEEYEVLRNVLIQYPARAVTQKEIDKVNGSIDKITAEGKKVAVTMQKRRQQFALLLHVIEDLQRAMDDQDEEEEGAVQGSAGAGTQEEGGAQQMDVD